MPPLGPETFRPETGLTTDEQFIDSSLKDVARRSIDLIDWDNYGLTNTHRRLSAIAIYEVIGLDGTSLPTTAWLSGDTTTHASGATYRHTSLHISHADKKKSSQYSLDKPAGDSHIVIAETPSNELLIITSGEAKDFATWPINHKKEYLSHTDETLSAIEKSTVELGQRKMSELYDFTKGLISDKSLKQTFDTTDCQGEIEILQDEDRLRLTLRRFDQPSKTRTFVAEWGIGLIGPPDTYFEHQENDFVAHESVNAVQMPQLAEAFMSAVKQQTELMHQQLAF